MSKIRWSDKERSLIAEEATRLFDVFPHLRTIEIARKAQRILPSDRHRDITGTQQVEWIQNIRDKHTSAVVVEKPVVVVESTPTPVEKPDIKKLVVDAISEVLVDILKDVIIQVKAELKPASIAEPVVPKQHSHKHKLKKIFVYGLRQDVADSVHKRLKDCYEFRFLDHANPDKIRAAVDWADETCLMIDFVSHSDQDIIKKRSKDVNLVRGTLSGLVSLLEEKYIEQ